MKKRLLAALLAILPTAVLAVGGYSDVSSGDWYATEVAYVSAKGLMNGIGNDQFGPGLPVTRGMLVTILHRLAGSPSQASGSGFADVAAGAYYADAVTWATANGIVTGYGNGKFGPNDNITREQLAAILYRFAMYMGENVDCAGSIRSFADHLSVSNYAYQAMIWAVERGLIGGIGNYLTPKGFVTRAQVAVILYRYLTSEGQETYTCSAVGYTKNYVEKFEGKNAAEDYFETPSQAPSMAMARPSPT